MAGAHTLTMYDQLKPKSTLVNEPLRNQQLDVSRQSAASSRKGGKSAMKSGSKKQPAIRSSFNNAQNVTKASTKSYGFSKLPRETGPQGNANIGPGAYDQSKADAMTRNRAPATVDMSRTTERSNKFKADNQAGPGQYDVRGQAFGENVKSFTIAEKREQRITTSPGPGSYSPDRSDSATKNKSPAADFSRQTARKDAERDASADFGTVDRFYNYPKEKPVYSIPEKREMKIQDSPGPGAYDANDGLTKTRSGMGNVKF